MGMLSWLAIGLVFALVYTVVAVMRRPRVAPAHESPIQSRPGGFPDAATPPMPRSKGNYGLWLVTIAAAVGLAAFMYATRLSDKGAVAPRPQNPPSVTPGPTPAPQPPTVSPPPDVQAFGVGAFYFGVMLFGMTGQYMWGLKSRQDFNLYEFVKPLWISFIVFAPFWSSLTVHGITYGAAAAAYQNGFFWKVVFEQQAPKPPAKPATTRS